MTIQEIFNFAPIEEGIIDIQWKIEHRCGNYESQKEFIRRLLKMRKRLLNHEFVMDEHYQLLLEEFNAAMREQLKIMRLETIKAYSAVIETGISGKIEAVGNALWDMGIQESTRFRLLEPRKCGRS